ncbi:MAG: hypothetical protein KDD48_08360 [Bdellovibrionales bacterium]|nr:hypothetical protein [Bdellovibrionales bacterium]
MRRYLGFYFPSCMAFCLALFFACSSDDLPESFRLGGFRVLGIVASQPEVNPDDTVILTPILSDLGGEGRAIMFSAKACVDPGVGFGAEPTCDENPTRVELASSQLATGLVAPNYTGLLTSTVSVTVPASSIVFDQRSTSEQFNGINYLVVMQFEPDGQEVVRAFKRIVVSTKTIKNQNPTFDSSQLFSMGNPVTSLPSETMAINIDLSSAAIENYDEQTETQEIVAKTETLETFWYISDGDLSPIITEAENETTYTPPSVLPDSHDVLIVAITRDGRGGLATLVFSY